MQQYLSWFFRNIYKKLNLPRLDKPWHFSDDELYLFLTTWKKTYDQRMADIERNLPPEKFEIARLNVEELARQDAVDKVHEVIRHDLDDFGYGRRKMRFLENAYAYMMRIAKGKNISVRELPSGHEPA
jgi:hypothetical protein